MVHALLDSLSNLANGSVILFLMIGVVVGLMTGLLPGLGGVVVLVLLLPFTLTMNPFEAFALLVSCYAVFSITGDITSVLIGIPAHPECAALVPDGYPMTKRGEAARALGATITSAAIGAVIGAVMLFLLIPVLRPVVIKVGSPEMFAIILLGLAMVGSLSGKSVLKGIVAAAFGMLLASVGENNQTGIVRYAFGDVNLIDGLSLVAVALGLFAVPEIMSLHARGKHGVARELRLDRGVMTGVRDTLHHPLLVVRSSIIGMVMSMVPGLGSAVGQWVAYGQAAQLSRHPERFGTGTIEGVIAPASANNSKEGGSMVPTIAVGVPGSSAMAILLGAFLVLGITPGPTMLSDHLNITYFLVLLLVVSNLVGAALSFVFLKQMARISVVPARILVPFIASLILVGAAVDAAKWTDVVTLLALGIVAWIMRQAGWSIVPVILGFVLGSSAEDYLWISWGTERWSWLHSPVVDAIFALTAILSIATAIRKSQSRRRGSAGMSIDSSGIQNRRWAWGSVAVAAGFTVIGITADLMALRWPLEAKTFPLVIGSSLAILGFFECINETRMLLRDRTSAAAAPAATETISLVTPQQPAGGPLLSRPSVPKGEPASGALLSQPAAATSATSLAVATSTQGATAGAAVLDPVSANDADEQLSTRLSLAGLAWLLGATALTYVFGFLAGLSSFVLIYALATGRGIVRAVLMAAVVAGGFYLLFVYELHASLPIPLLGPSWV